MSPLAERLSEQFNESQRCDSPRTCPPLQELGLSQDLARAIRNLYEPQSFERKPWLLQPVRQEGIDRNSRPSSSSRTGAPPRPRPPSARGPGAPYAVRPRSAKSSRSSLASKDTMPPEGECRTCDCTADSACFTCCSRPGRPSDELLLRRMRSFRRPRPPPPQAESDPEDAELEEAKLHKQARIRDWLQRKEVELHQRRQRQRAEEEQMRELQELEDQRKEEHQAQLLRERRFRLRCAALRQKELDLELEQHRAFPPEARVQAVGAQTLAAYSTPRIGRKHARCRSARAQRLETDTRPQLCSDLSACG